MVFSCYTSSSRECLHQLSASTCLYQHTFSSTTYILDTCSSVMSNSYVAKYLLLLYLTNSEHAGSITTLYMCSRSPRFDLLMGLIPSLSHLLLVLLHVLRHHPSRLGWNGPHLDLDDMPIGHWSHNIAEIYKVFTMYSQMCPCNITH